MCCIVLYNTIQYTQTTIYIHFFIPSIPRSRLGVSRSKRPPRASVLCNQTNSTLLRSLRRQYTARRTRIQHIQTPVTQQHHIIRQGARQRAKANEWIGKASRWNHFHSDVTRRFFLLAPLLLPSPFSSNLTRSFTHLLIPPVRSLGSWCFCVH